MAKFLFCQAPTFHHLEGIIKLASPFAPLISKTFPGEQERRRGRSTKTYSLSKDLKTFVHFMTLICSCSLCSFPLCFYPIWIVLTSLLCYLPKLAVMKSFELHVHALFFRFSLLQTIPIHFPLTLEPPFPQPTKWFLICFSFAPFHLWLLSGQ